MSYSERGRLVLVRNGFRYTKNYTLKNSEKKWICSNRRCDAKFYTVGPKNRVTRIICDEHCHSAIWRNKKFRRRQRELHVSDIIQSLTTLDSYFGHILAFEYVEMMKKSNGVESGDLGGH